MNSGQMVVSNEMFKPSPARGEGKNCNCDRAQTSHVIARSEATKQSSWRFRIRRNPLTRHCEARSGLRSKQNDPVNRFE